MLSAQGFERLLSRIDPDPHLAGERYASIRARLVRLFAWRGCDLPEEAADETIDRVARRLEDGVVVTPPDPWAYFAGVAHNVFREVARGRQREQAALAEWGGPPPTHEEDSRMPCLERCLAALAPASRELILRYHEGDGRHRIEARARLGRDLGLDSGALRVRAHRVRTTLETCVQDCLQEGA
jgi:DNA-directed RNA polymerase specialized sigma24 family protein